MNSNIRNLAALARHVRTGDTLIHHKLIIGTAFLVLSVMIASLVAAEAQGTKTDGNTSVTPSSSDIGKNGSKQTLEVPELVRPIPGESEADKLKRMVQFIKENRPRPFIPHDGDPRDSQVGFCRQFMEALLQMRNVEAIEPDFVTGSDEKVAMDEVTNKLNLYHCGDMKLEYPDPDGENPMLRGREIFEFNDVSQIGGPPYRVYNIQLVPGRETRYPVLYYDAGKRSSLFADHTGFARLDLRKCKIEGEIPGSSEILRGSETLSEIGRNVLVKYKGQVFALMLDCGSYSGSHSGFKDYYRLDLYRLSQPQSIGFVCHWSYYR